MSDPKFELQLGRLFDKAPEFPDAILFNARIEQKLAAGWALRRVAVIGTGAMIGLGAAVQFMNREIIGRVSSLSLRDVDGLSTDTNWLIQRLGTGFDLTHNAPLLLTALIGVSALAFALVRLVDEI